jgi:hypothetical protein
MAHMTDISLNKSIQLTGLIEFGRDYCSDHFGRFFQSKYSPPLLPANKFEIPTFLANSKQKNCFAICVVMNNHIMEIKYFSDIFTEWDKEFGAEEVSSAKDLNKINSYINDQRLLMVIKRFKKINDEIMIGHCKGNEFTPFN